MGLISKVVEHVVVSVFLPRARERLERGVAYDLTSPEARTDLCATHRRLRNLDRTHRTRLVEALLGLTCYRDLEAVQGPQAVANAGRILVETIPLSRISTSRVPRWFVRYETCSHRFRRSTTSLPRC